MAINLKDTVQIIRGKKTDIAARIGANGELNWADDTYELYIHDGKTRGGHLIGKASGTAGVVGGAGIAVSTSDGISTVSIKRDPTNVLYATTDGAGVRIGTSGALQITAQNALDLRVAEGGGLVVDSNGLKVDSSVLTSVFRYAGQVNSADDLPDDASIGDVYDVKDSGANYVWTGSSWDNLGGILSVDPSPTQGSTNPVASGGVYDAIQDTKLSGDGTTVTVASNTITAKDIAIGGDESDLASARGQIGNPRYETITDFNAYTKAGMYPISGVSTAENRPPYGSNGFLVVLASSSGHVKQFFYRIGTPNSNDHGSYFRTYAPANATWSDWHTVITSESIGDGITVNNGIISVPEYEGATASAPATSGLVPSATAAEREKPLRADGTWADSLDCDVDGNAGTATKLATKRTIDGVSFDGSAAITHYGTCSTAAGTAAKTVSLSGFSLVTGARITVRFTVTNTSSSPTLNVNSTGAKAIRYRNSAISAGYLAANRTYEFVYDGSCWQLVGDIDTSTTYSSATESKSGIVELATTAEVQAGTDTARAVTPKGIASRTATESRTGLAEIATQAEVDAGTDTTRIITPKKLAESYLNKFRKSLIGSISYFARASLPEGWVIADGSLVLFADYPELKEAYDDGAFAGMLLEATASASDKSTWAGKWVKHAQGTGLYTPRLQGLFLRNGSIYGKYNQAGVPGFIGGCAIGFPDGQQGTFGHTGIVKPSGYVIGMYGGGSLHDGTAGHTGGIVIDSSLGSDIYGASDTVMTASADTLYGIYLGRVSEI